MACESKKGVNNVVFSLWKCTYIYIYTYMYVSRLPETLYIDSTSSSRKNGRARCGREIGIFRKFARTRSTRRYKKKYNARASRGAVVVVCLSFLLFFFQRHFTLHEQNAGTFKKEKVLIAKLSFFPSPLPPRISPYFSCILICNTLKHTYTQKWLCIETKKNGFGI